MLEILNDLKPFLPSKKEQAKILAKIKKETKIKQENKYHECILISLDAKMKLNSSKYTYENKSQKYLNERDFIKKYYKNIKFNIFYSNSTYKQFRKTKNQDLFLIDNNKDIIPQIVQRLDVNKKYLFVLNNQNTSKTIEFLNLSKLYDIDFLEFKKDKSEINVYKINGLFESSFSNVAFVLREFSSTLKMPYLSTNEPLYMQLRELARVLQFAKYKEIFTLYEKIKLNIENLEKDSIFYPFRQEILGIFRLFRINEIKINIENDKSLSTFNNYLILAKLFCDKEYYINSALALKDGIDVGIYRYFVGDFGVHLVRENKFGFFWNEIFKDENLSEYIKKYLKIIFKLRCKVASIRNNFVHLENKKDNQILIKELKVIIQNIEQIFNPSALTKLEPFKKQIAKKIMQKLQAN
ncbi:hypothetical protein [Campylobacter canadensis]|uniref:Uncharacterized protein n=1 Tax=Campylobacter canadensis TaxID=449520 RepID=A0ABS7WSL6_9BACT|nr:hypothetical protein [Campylobacter canadensis]MBZ7987764.1 hypothetical protein [Campylobacter canadensis]MBZ7995080.1 hypothetical protein [Campylobacter canadensis]MBZ7996645.1 hypothetical protein [Campylobacter canadensis]MBZ7998561.1 hypothetical protein [Campylobacter canadensis]MBZ8000252.1 hypothetical protein [Campylobacter canadensis]